MKGQRSDGVSAAPARFAPDPAPPRVRVFLGALETGLGSIAAPPEAHLIHNLNGRDALMVEYVERISLRTDAWILWRTIPSLLGSKHGD